VVLELHEWAHNHLLVTAVLKAQDRAPTSGSGDHRSHNRVFQYPSFVTD